MRVFISFFIYLGTVAPSVQENCFSGGHVHYIFLMMKTGQPSDGKKWKAGKAKFNFVGPLGPKLIGASPNIKVVFCHVHSA